MAGVVSKLVDLKKNVAELHEKKEMLRLLSKFNVDLDNINEDMAELEKAAPKAAAKLRTLLARFMEVDEAGKYAEQAISRFKEDIGKVESKVDKWYEKWAEKGVDFFKEHVTEISAATLATNAFHKALENTRSATDHIVQTSGDLNTSIWDTIKTTTRLGTAISDARVATAGYGASIEQVEEATRRYYDLFQSTKGMEKVFEPLAAMGRVWKEDFGSMFEYVEKRQREWGQTAEDTVQEMGSIVSATEDLKAELESAGESGSKVAKFLRTDLWKTVKESAEEVGGMGVNMGALAKLEYKAYGWAKKFGLSMQDSLNLAKNTAKLLKPNDVVSVQFGEEVVKEYKEALRTNKGDEYLQRIFKGQAGNAKLLLDEIVSGNSQMMLNKQTFDALREAALLSEEGTKKVLSKNLEFLRGMGSVVAIQSALGGMGIEGLQQATMANLIARGELDKALKLIEDDISKNKQDEAARAKGLDTEKAKNDANLAAAQKGSHVAIDGAVETIRGYLADPVKSLGLALGLLATKTAYSTFLQWKIRKAVGDVERATAELAAKGVNAGQQNIPGAGGGPGVGDVAEGVAGKGAGTAAKEAEKVGEEAAKKGKFGGVVGFLKKNKKTAIVGAALATAALAWAAWSATKSKEDEKKDERKPDDRPEHGRKAVEQHFINSGMSPTQAAAAAAVDPKTLAELAANGVDKTSTLAGAATTVSALASSTSLGMAGFKSMGKLSSKVAKGIPLLGLVVGAADLAASYSEEGGKGAAKSLAGSLTGWGAVAAGAAIGSVVPVIGTAIGGAIGAVVGIAGSYGAEALTEKIYDAYAEVETKQKKELYAQYDKVQKLLDESGFNPTKRTASEGAGAVVAEAAKKERRAVQEAALRETMKGGQQSGGGKHVKAVAHSINPTTGDLILRIENPAALVARYDASVAARTT